MLDIGQAPRGLRDVCPSCKGAGVLTAMARASEVQSAGQPFQGCGLQEVRAPCTVCHGTGEVERHG